ncbi:protein of unknown function [Micromonospora phaseoli]|uniref:Uncharacterized protein n=1 Tax=Micromonospora phaseoli TaxID=1144548 RepID=A0A1H7DVN3_9ACTN|nr:DUF2610 domain-containing protein [Micromonospora phaseoli]PZV89197.1 uncharacterized protein DUF2610 [Micromonospora phaseoli]GIJ80556.1 hypothetical protein Xph01_49880 [Micromonospora phaseoli]SEK05454.1 protein of unknown function [Micromonospora phaseoli]
MRPFLIPCQFGAARAPFPLYAGEPAAGTHPMEQQSAWLGRVRGGTVPVEVMDSFAKLFAIALENNVSFEELCVYAMEQATNDEATTDATDGDPAESDNAPDEPDNIDRSG